MLKNIKKSWKFQIPDEGPKLILRILLFLQFAGGFFVYLNVYDYFPMTKIEVFPQQVHSTWNVGNTAARTQSHGQEGCSCSAIEVLFRKIPSLSETRGVVSHKEQRRKLECRLVLYHQVTGDLNTSTSSNTGGTLDLSGPFPCQFRSASRATVATSIT